MDLGTSVSASADSAAAFICVIWLNKNKNVSRGDIKSSESE